MRWRGLAAPGGTPGRNPREQGAGSKPSSGLDCPPHPKDKGGHQGGGETKAAGLRSGEGRRGSKGAPPGPVRSRRPYLRGEGWDAHTSTPARTRVLSAKCAQGRGALYARPEP